MENIVYKTILATVAWFLVGGIIYMNPFVSRIYKKYEKHPSMKEFSSRKRYLSGVFFVAGLVPVFFITISYEYIKPISFVNLALIISAIRIIPRMCDMWMQTSYPNKLLAIELVNGIILSFVISYIITLTY